jgi:putative endonuclease
LSERYPWIAVYIMASRPFGVIYTGVTSDLRRRAYEHREGLIEGFTTTHNCKMLVWHQSFERMTSAIMREHTIKGYPRVWKLNLIEQLNPEWKDLYPDLGW